MAPEEAVICNQMNAKQVNENQNQELPTTALTHVMWSSGCIWKPLRSRIPQHTLCSLLVLMCGANLEMRWKK